MKRHVAVVLLAGATAWAAPWAGLVTAVQGTVQVGGQAVKPLSRVADGDAMRLGPGASVTVAFLGSGERFTVRGPATVTVAHDNLVGAAATKEAPIHCSTAGMAALSNNDRLGGFNPNEDTRNAPVPPPTAAMPPPGRQGVTPDTSSAVAAAPPLMAVRDLDLGLLHPGRVASWHLVWTDQDRSIEYAVPGQTRVLTLKGLHFRGHHAHGDVQEGQTYRLQLADEHGPVGTFRIRILTRAEEAAIEAAARDAEVRQDPAVWALLLADFERRGAWSAAVQALSDTAVRHPELKAAIATLQSQVQSDLAAFRKEAADAP